jgi:hypothetical protein
MINLKKIPKANLTLELSKDMITSVSNDFQEDGRFLIYL